MLSDRGKVFAYIDQHFSEHLNKLQELVRQPSVSPENKGIKECAQLVQKLFIDLGCKARLVETRGNPVVYGRYDAGASKTILVYMMYDTMPTDEEGWKVDPFAGELVNQPPFGRCLVARGAVNTKGELQAFLNACESIKATGQDLPVNLIFMAEGEEELGSRHLPEFVEKYAKELALADAVFWPGAEQFPQGDVVLELGVKGIVYFELELDGASWGKGPGEFGIHGSLKAALDSPVWRMIQALATMTGPDGNKVLVKDLFRDVHLDKDDLMLIEQLGKNFTPEKEKALKDLYKIKSFVDGVTGVELLKRLLLDPTLNIDGIWAGYTGEGTKTLLPHKVTAKMDVRLVPKMSNKNVLPLIRKHLDSHGFPEVRIRQLEEGYNWARTSHRDPAVQAVLKSYRELGVEPEVSPSGTGSAPFYLFKKDPLNLPVVFGGLGHGALAHSPNEYLVIDEGGPTGGLRTLEKSYVAMLDNFSEMG